MRELTQTEKLEKLEQAAELLNEACDLCEEALEGDINADAYFLATLREIAGRGGNPYNQAIDTMIARVSNDAD